MSGEIEKRESKELEPVDIKEAKLIHRAIKARWNISPEAKATLMKRIELTLDSKNLNNRDLSNLARCLIAMDSANQIDEINADKNRRLDEGLPTENTTFVVEVPKPRENFSNE